ncbi:MAG: hypothetical protein Q7S66_03890 [bacterium]|nr:hypothetical protein [bacterium]
MLSSHTKEILGVVAGIVSFLGYFPYILSIYKGQTKPSRSSWWIWSFVGMVILFSYYSAGARNTIWIPIVFVVCPLLVAILSIRYGQGERLIFLDKICLVLSFASLLVWYLSKTPAVALFVNIVIDFFGFLPTIKKSIALPEYENKTTWVLFFIGSLFNLVAIDQFSINIVSYPLYMLIMDIIMIFLIFKKNKISSA